MARHRDVRTMDIYDDYEGYEDTYGHSVEEDYSISPSTAAQFTYGSRRHDSPQASFAHPPKQDDILEESEDDEDKDHQDSCSTSRWPQLNDEDEAKLRSCLDELRNVLGDEFQESSLLDAAVKHSFDCEKALDSLLNPTVAPALPTAAGGVTTPSKVSSAVLFTVGEPLPAKTKPTVDRRSQDVQFPVDSLARMTVESPVSRPPATIVLSGSRASLDVRGASADVGVADSGESVLRCATPAVQRVLAESSVGEAGRSSPSLAKSASKARLERLDAKKEYERRKAAGKDLINLVVIGHVDAGKSTLMGHLLYKVGAVSQRQMHKYEQESRKIGKASFMYAWVLDETEEERTRGVTMDVGQTSFETATKLVNVLDAPGHKDFIPNMITGAAQADSALLVVNATNGEFETGFESGGQTREHAMLAKSLGVSQVIVAVNKMDTVGWSEERYKEIVKKLQAFLKQAAFKDSDVCYVPCSGLAGVNLAANAKELSWYKGECLLKEIEKLRLPERQTDKPFRMCVHDIYKGAGGGFSLAGRVEAGDVQANDRVIVMPAGEVAIVKTILVDELPVQYGLAGDFVTVTMSGIDMNKIQIGNLLCDALSPSPVATKISARVVIFSVEVPITRGFPVVFHYQSMNEPANISRLVSQLHKGTGEVIKKNPRCLTKNTTGVVEIEFQRPVCVELYKDYKELGRFMVRAGGTTIAAGVITEIVA